MKWPTVSSPLHRTLEATGLNAVANDPAVRLWLGGDGVLDLTADVSNPVNLAASCEEGGFVAKALGEGRYEIHSLFLPTKATAAVKAMRSALDYVFAASDAVELVTKVPTDNAAADGLARLAGFRLLFTSTMEWTSTETKSMGVRTLHIDEWALRSSVALCMGRWLHEQFADVLESHASQLPPHSADDETHDRMAGAAAMMMRAGNIAKAVLFYNRWAVLAGYPPIKWLRDHPTILDLEGMIVELTGEDIEVLSCR
jgi:hypothetical protein